MAVKIDDEMIDYVGILAKLSLSPEEKEAAKSDMSRMLEYIDMPVPYTHLTLPTILRV